jgi:hypothetical protein
MPLSDRHQCCKGTASSAITCSTIDREGCLGDRSSRHRPHRAGPREGNSRQAIIDQKKAPPARAEFAIKARWVSGDPEISRRRAIGEADSPKVGHAHPFTLDWRWAADMMVADGEPKTRRQRLVPAHRPRWWSGSCATDKDATARRGEMLASSACDSSANGWIFLIVAERRGSRKGARLGQKRLRKARPRKESALFQNKIVRPP